MKRLVVFAVCISLFTACSKKEDGAAPPIVGTWKKTLVEKKTNTAAWAVDPRPCQLDDIEEYSQSGSWVLYDGPNQCSPGTGIMNGTWRLAAGDGKVIFTFSGVPGEYESTVVSLSSSQMILLQSAGDVNNTQYRFTYTKN